MNLLRFNKFLLTFFYLFFIIFLKGGVFLNFSLSGIYLGSRSYVKSNGSNGFTVSVSDLTGRVFDLNSSSPFDFPVGSKVDVIFDIVFFNRKPSYFILNSIIQSEV